MQANATISALVRSTICSASETNNSIGAQRTRADSPRTRLLTNHLTTCQAPVSTIPG